MPGNDRRERPPGEIGAGREQILPEMPFERSEDQIKQPRQDSKPGSLEMEIAAPAVLVGKHVVVARGDGCSGSGNRQFEQRRSKYVASFAPIKARVGDENFDSADEQSQETQ